MTSDDVLAELGRIRTPIIYDAVEKFNLRPRTDGLMEPGLVSQIPSLGPMIGYAVTGKVVGALPPADGERRIEFRQMWEYAARSASPSVMVVQDLDQPSARSCSWGDVAASICLQLGMVGTVTNGGVRDLPEVEKLGFHLFAPNPVVGHAHIRWVEIDTPVVVGGLVVYPGDLIHGDEHGVMVIPKELDLAQLLDFTREFLKSEATIVDYCRSNDFDLDKVCRLMSEHDERTIGHLN